MKPKKTCDVQRVTELGENILKAQNTMLAAKVDELKKELLNLKSLPENRDPELIYTEELSQSKKLCNQLSRRIRIIMAYNEGAIQKKLLPQDIEEETFECLCGANQIDSIKYLLLNGHQQKQEQQQPQQQQQQIIQQSQQQQQQQASEPPVDKKAESEYVKQLIEEHSEQKSQLLHQIEELKLQQRLSEEQFYQTSLFADLVQQNNYLTASLFNVEDQLQQAQLVNKEQLEKFQQQILQFSQECEQKIREFPQQQEQIKIEIKQIDDHMENTLIQELKSQVENSAKVVEDLKLELQQSRERNKDVHNQYIEVVNQKQALQKTNSDLQLQLLSKMPSKDEKIEQISLRYEKHKQLLHEIEQEFVIKKENEFILRFREFVGYVKMRDEKVRQLEQFLETKNQDIANLKRQITQLLEELDYNSNSYNSINETNKNLSKLVNETQQNLSKATTEKVDERIKFETERQQYLSRLAAADETIKQLMLQNEQYRKLMTQIENERQSNKETIRLLQKMDQENKQKLLQKEWDLNKISEESKIYSEREKLSESINIKFMKKAEKSKSKLKQLKLSLKNECKDMNNELYQSMKNMVDCQQCKKRLKQVILLKCLHMFCKHCIDDNQKNRNRACPVCRTKYGLEDVKQIILN